MSTAADLPGTRVSDVKSTLIGALEQAHLAALWYYPIKSCGGHAVAEAAIDLRGIRHDRELMVVAADDNTFLTQRQHPRMALIIPQRQDEHLLLQAVDAPDLELALHIDGPLRDVTVWRDTVQAVDQGDVVAHWLSAYLGLACRLVRMAPSTVRRVDPQYATHSEDQVGFADGYPFLVLSEESLADLNGRLVQPVPMNRFRPNLVLAGSGVPYGEDRLRRFALGSLTFDVVKPCARCVLTTVDQHTGVGGKEPLRTLATYRKQDDRVLFGQNLIHSHTGLLRVGQPLRVLELQDPAEY